MTKRHIRMLNSIVEFRTSHGLPHNTTNHVLTATQANAHADHFQEELDEYKAASDAVGRVDAAMDLFIFAMGALSHAGELHMYKWNLADSFTGAYLDTIPKTIEEHIANLRKYHNDCFEIECVADWAIELVLAEFNSTDINHFYNVFDIVHASNMSKLCKTKEEAQAKCIEYDNKYHNEWSRDAAKNPLYTCRPEETRLGWAIKRNDGKLLKGPHFFNPEPKIREYVNQFIKPNHDLEAASIADDEQP